MDSRLKMSGMTPIFLQRSARRFSLPPISLVGPIVLFLGLAAWSTFTSPYPNQSLQWLITLVCYGLLAFSVMVLLSSSDGAGGAVKSVKLILGLCVAMGIFESVLALYQYGVLGKLRPAGTFFNPNFLAAYLVPLFCLCLALFVRSWSRYSPSPQPSPPPQGGEGLKEGAMTSMRPPITPLPQGGREGRVRGIVVLIGWIVLLGLFLTGLALTGSRGGTLAMLAGLSVVLTCWFGRKGLGGLLLFLVLFLLLPNPLRDRLWLEHEANPVAYARLEMWTGAAHMLLDHPLGVGLGTYKYFAPQYAFPVEEQIARYGKVPQTAHNEWLQFGVELGLPAFAVMVWAAVALGMRGWKTFRRTTSPRDRGLVIGLLAGVTSLFVHAAVDSVFHAPAVVILLVILVAALVRISQDEAPSPLPLPHPGGEEAERRPITSMPLSKRKGASDGNPSTFIPLPHPGGEDSGEGDFLPRRPISLSFGSRIVWGVFGTAALVVVTFFAVRLGAAWLTYEQGLTALKSHRYNQAVDRFHLAARLDPTNAAYANALGAAHYHWAQALEGEAQEEKFDAAVDHLRHAVQLNPADGKLYGFLGWVSMNVARHRAGQGTFENGSNPWIVLAIRAYQQAMTRQPYKVSHQLQLATLYEATGRSKKAEALVRQAIRLEPNYLPARVLLVKLALERGNREGARAEYQEIRTRYERYKHWSKTSLEADFLEVDWGDLRAALAHTRRPGDAVSQS